MLKNRLIYIIAIFVHMFFLLSFLGNTKIDMCLPFWGASYYGDAKFYANSILLFGIYVLYSFGETKRYISGYGILLIVRTLNKKIVARHIFMKQLKNLLILTMVFYGSFLIETYMMGYKILNVKWEQMAVDILLFCMVMYSLLLWQSIIEIIADERIAIGMVLSFVILNFFVGNMVFTYKLAEELNLIFYVNLYATLRTDNMELDESVMVFVLLLICILQMILLRHLIKKKDLYQLSNS